MQTQEVYLCTEEALQEAWPFIPAAMELFPIALVRALFRARDNKSTWWTTGGKVAPAYDERFRAVCNKFEPNLELEKFNPGWPGELLPKPSSQAYVFLVTLDGHQLLFHRLVA